MGCEKKEFLNPIDPEIKCWELWGVCYNIDETTSIDLSNSELTGEIPKEIGYLINLEYLDLHGNYGLTGNIPEELFNLVDLKFLSLGSTNLSGAISDGIGNLTKLEYLQLNWADFTSLPSSIGNLTELRELWCQFTNFQSIPESIGNLTKLITLQFVGSQLTSLPTSICSMDLLLSNWSSFWFRSNHICGELPPCLTLDDIEDPGYHQNCP